MRQKLGKEKILLGNLWILVRGPNVILQVFPNEFRRRFKKNPNVIPGQAVLLSRDIILLDKKWLNKEATAVSGSDGIHAIFYKIMLELIGKIFVL